MTAVHRIATVKFMVQHDWTACLACAALLECGLWPGHPDLAEPCVQRNVANHVVRMLDVEHPRCPFPITTKERKLCLHKKWPAGCSAHRVEVVSEATTQQLLQLPIVQLSAQKSVS